MEPVLLRMESAIWRGSPWIDKMYECVGVGIQQPFMISTRDCALSSAFREADPRLTGQGIGRMIGLQRSMNSSTTAQSRKEAQLLQPNAKLSRRPSQRS